MPSVIVPTIITFAIVIIYGNYMSQSDYGEYSLSVLTISLIFTIMSAFLSTSILRFRYSYVEKEKLYELISTYFLTIVIAQFSLAAILYSLIGIDGLFIALFTLSISLFNLFKEYARSSERAKAYSLITIMAPLGTLTLIISLIYNDILEVTTALFAMYAPMLFLSAFYTVYLIYNRLIRFTFNWSLFKDTLHYGMPLAFSTLLYLVISGSDRYFIKYFMDEEDLGLYSFAYKLSELSMSKVTMVLIVSLLPQMIRIYESSGRKKAEDLLKKYLDIHIMVIIPLIFLVFLYIDEILSIFFPIYQEGAGIVRMVSVGTLFFTFSTFTDKAYQVTKRTKTLMLILVGTSVLNIALNLTLIPFLGIMGAVIATIVSYLFHIIISLIQSRALLNISLSYHKLFSIFFLNIVLASILIFIEGILFEENITRLIVGTGIYLLIYGALVYGWIYPGRMRILRIKNN